MIDKSLPDNMLIPQYRLLRQQLDEHPLYAAIQSRPHLKVFMQQHVYAVWDFMSLIKALQQHLAPINLPWVPPGNIRHANFINQLVMEEESDRALMDTPRTSHASHFQGYCDAMAEIGADTRPVLHFIQYANTSGIEPALQSQGIPSAARQFMRFTFDTIKRNQPHLLAAVLAYGRESLVPVLFRALLERLQISTATTPMLHAYLTRHIELDEHEHGPLAMTMAQELCDGSAEKLSELEEIAVQALQVRLSFWDAIHHEITQSTEGQTSDQTDPEFMTRWAS